MGTMEDRETAYCPNIYYTFVHYTREPIRCTAKKNAMWRVWKLIWVGHPLPWIIWSNGVEGQGRDAREVQTCHAWPNRAETTGSRSAARLRWRNIQRLTAG